jgi:hypothetical protein
VLIHDLCQVAVYFKKDIDTDAEVWRKQESFVVLSCKFFDFIQLLRPAGAATTTGTSASKHQCMFSTAVCGDVNSMAHLLAATVLS